MHQLGLLASPVTVADHVNTSLLPAACPVMSKSLSTTSIKTYQTRTGEIPALVDINLDIKDGEFVSIIGPSGCGKSTLLYMLGGFIAANHGKILVDSKLVTGPGVDRGVVFQEYALFPWLTVEQNICYGLEMLGSPDANATKLFTIFIRTVNLQGFERRFPRESPAESSSVSRLRAHSRAIPAFCSLMSRLER